MNPQWIDRLHQRDSNALFRQSTIGFITVALTGADAVSLSLVALYNPYLSDNGTLGTLIIMVAVCFVLNYIPLMLSKTGKDIRCGFSSLTRSQYRLLCTAALSIMALLFSVLVVVRMTSIALPEEEQTVSGFADFGDGEETLSEEPTGGEEEAKIPLSAYALTFLVSLEPLGTSVANYFIMSVIYDPFEEHKDRARRALRQVEKRLQSLHGDEYLLASDSESAERAAEEQQYRTFLERLRSQRETCELDSRQALAEVIHADADQLDRLLPSDDPPEDSAA